MSEPPVPEDNDRSPATIAWDIRRAGRAWKGEEARARFALTPEKFEMMEGRLFFSHRERLLLLGLLLENVGIDQALRLAPLTLWQEALRDQLWGSE